METTQPTTVDPMGAMRRLVEPNEIDRRRDQFQYKWNHHEFWLTADGEFVAAKLPCC